MDVWLVYQLVNTWNFDNIDMRVTNVEIID